MLIKIVGRFFGDFRTPNLFLEERGSETLKKKPPAPPCGGQPAAGEFVLFAILTAIYSLLPTVRFLLLPAVLL